MIQGELSGVRVGGAPQRSPLWLARDARGRMHLLVEISSGTEPLRVRATRGLEVLTENLRVSSHPPATYIDLSCLETAHQKTFAAVCCDIISATASVNDSLRNAVLRTLERWRNFWNVDPAGLSREGALGLFGELWFLLRWMTSASRATLERWQGPTGARHDFQWDTASIEVKTTAITASGPVHWIANLDQLDDPVTGSLYLFSLQTADDALAANTLPTLVNHLEGIFASDPDATQIFAERLAQAGYNPAHADRYNRSLRVVAEELYRVNGSFPRLVKSSFPAGLPPGIEGVSYSLSLAACAPWRIATSPQDPGLDFLATS